MKILIIEDESGISSFLKQGLEEENYVVSVAIDGQSGLQKAIAEQPDLILLDWMLPQLSGLEVCKAIRRKDKSTPILFLTAKDTIQETIEGLKAGANDYIKKPFSFEELLERIKIHFRNKNENKVLSLGNIILDKNTFQVFVDNNEVNLTQREFEFLAYLIKNKGKVCTRTNIIEDVWN
ncbi:MAG: response regulator transcription factor, partial [Flavobacterium sp.]|nr:response regulator transcription factor [Flavobacterium sp.]